MSSSRQVFVSAEFCCANKQKSDVAFEARRVSRAFQQNCNLLRKIEHSSRVLTLRRETLLWWPKRVFHSRLDWNASSIQVEKSSID